jgi:crotonobetainyl-CoA:carnitine CoA-transferase CaiB-like acyl-CoA transferase
MGNGAPTASTTAPLAGVRVVDLTTVLSGPLATSTLADQGADVIKVEAPGAGDLTRSVGSSRNGMTAMCQLANRGKRSIVIDLGTDDGRAVLRRLVSTADVFAQNFRPGVADRLGIGYDALRAVNPQLVYLSIAGFGFEGPLAAMKVYDNLIQATSGIAAQQADDDGQPRFVRNLMCDKVTALVAAQAVTAALFARDRGAGGQHIELAMLDAAISFLWSDAGTEHTFVGDGVQRSASGAGNALTPHADGWTTAAAVTDDEFRAFCLAYGCPDVADDPSLATLRLRLADPARYRRARQRVDEAAATLTTNEAIERLHAADVPAAALVPVADVPRQPQVVANATFATTEHPVAGALIEPRPPARFAGQHPEPAHPAPTMGQHTDEVLRDVGYALDEIESLRERGVVG